MTRFYRVCEDFALDMLEEGKITLRQGDLISYDHTEQRLHIGSMSYQCTKVLIAIQKGWLTPVDNPTENPEPNHE